MTNITDEARKARNAYQRKRRANMSEAEREKERAYKREWQRMNKDKVKAQQLRYWQKKAKEEAEAAAQSQE